MGKVLVVIDMQHDFIDGALGSPEALDIVPNVIQKIKEFEGHIIFTRDTHTELYLNTLEGKKLPVTHCIRGSFGWQIQDEIFSAATDKQFEIIDKPTFGSMKLAERLAELHQQDGIENITLIGLCTDICVITNAMNIKSTLWETPIAVEASCCAGVTPVSHLNALEAMKMCHIDVI